MGINVNTNVASINARNQIGPTNRLLQRAFQRLSSGLRINSAADDAAGLAISSRFTSQFRGLNQAIRNANDGVSFTQTAEGALSSTTDNLQRIRELSIQAANGTLTDSDRNAIQAEIDQLSDEIGRTAETTTFNGEQILNGAGGSRSFQVGANARETISVNNIDARPTTLGAAAVATGGQVDASGIDAGELTINGVEIRATQASDDTVSTAQNEGSAIAVAEAINDVSDATGVTATVNATEVTGGAVGGGSLDQNNQLVINGQAITSVDVAAGDAGDELIDAINAEAETTGVTAARNADGAIELTAQDGRNIDIQTTGTAAAITGLSAGTTTGTVTLTSEEQFTIGGTDAADAGFQSSINGVSRDASVQSIDVRTQEGANRALSIVDRALEDVSTRRSELGAVQNRFTSTISNLSNVAENVAAANSRIQDADFAQETSELLRRRILAQANISVLGQANVSQQSALTLLGS